MKRSAPEDTTPSKKFKPDQDSYTEEDFLDDYDEEFYKDDADFQNLSNMSELAREEILTERFDEREKLKFFRDKAINDGKLIPTKTLEKKNAKSSALHDLKQKRLVPVKRREIKESRISEISSSSQEPIMDLATLSALIMTRKDVAKLVGKPYFEAVVVGCYVRVSVGEDTSRQRIYRLAKIDGFKEKMSYVVEGTKTNKYLMLKLGDSVKSFSIAVLSNSPVTSLEFAMWYKETLPLHKAMPTVSQIEAQTARIKETIENYVYTESEVNKILEKKPQKKSLYEEKVRLSSLRDLALDEKRMGEYQELCGQVERVEKMIEQKTQKKRVFKEEETPIPLNDDDEDDSVKSQDKFDPFARRPTRSQGLFVTTESPKSVVETDKFLSPLDSPGKKLQREHDFDIDLVIISEPKTMSKFEFITPLVPEGKRLSLADYQKSRKNY